MARRVEYKHPTGVFWGEVQSWSENQGTDITFFIKPDHNHNALHVVQGSQILKD
jgi:hypothetical protein